MRRICIVVVFIVFVFTGVCLADGISGKITSVDKTKKTLQISGVLVQARDAWVQNDREYPVALGSLVPGDYIEVTGMFTGASEIKASNIEQDEPECGIVIGKIASIGAKKREIIINGIVIKVTAETWLEGPSHVRIPLELFAPGYSVECRGEWTGSGELTAFKVIVD